MGFGNSGFNKLEFTELEFSKLVFGEVDLNRISHTFQTDLVFMIFPFAAMLNRFHQGQFLGLKYTEMCWLQCSTPDWPASWIFWKEWAKEKGKKRDKERKANEVRKIEKMKGGMGSSIFHVKHWHACSSSFGRIYCVFLVYALLYVLCVCGPSAWNKTDDDDDNSQKYKYRICISWQNNAQS